MIIVRENIVFGKKYVEKLSFGNYSFFRLRPDSLFRAQVSGHQFDQIILYLGQYVGYARQSGLDARLEEAKSRRALSSFWF